MRQQLTFFSTVIKLHYWAAMASFFQHGSAYYSINCMERENAMTHNRQGKSFKYLSALLLEEFLFSPFQTLHLTKLFFCKSSNSIGNYNTMVLSTEPLQSPPCSNQKNIVLCLHGALCEGWVPAQTSPALGFWPYFSKEFLHLFLWNGLDHHTQLITGMNRIQEVWIAYIALDTRYSLQRTRLQCSLLLAPSAAGIPKIHNKGIIVQCSI